MDSSEQSGGGDSLLESPQIDATIKVYRGGGMEDGGEDKEHVGGIYVGVGGTPVQRHQVSLYNTPVKRKELKVYKGGGEKPLFRGKGIEEFQKNPELYTAMIETGKKSLQSKIGEGVKSNEIDIEDLDGLKKLTVDNDVISTDNSHSCFIGKQHTFTLIPKLLNVFIYGEKESDGNLEFRSQLIVFSTVLKKQEPELKDGLTKILTNLTAGLVTEVNEVATKALKGAETTIQSIAEAVGTPLEKPTLKLKETSVSETPLDTSTGMLGLLELQIEGDIWILKHKANISRTGPNPPTIFLGPYWLRDPETLTAESFFSNLTKSELLYMNDILFKGYPYSVIKDILLEKKEDFFTTVWKPLINNNVMDDFTFQLLTDIDPARKLLSDIRTEQEERLSMKLDSYLKGHGLNTDVHADADADVDADADADVPVPVPVKRKPKENGEWTEEGEGAEGAEGAKGGEGAEGAKGGKGAEGAEGGKGAEGGEDGEGGEGGEGQDNSGNDNTSKNDDDCKELLDDTSTDPIIVYLRSLLTLITEHSIKNSTGLNSTRAAITEYISNLKKVLKTSPTSNVKKIQSELTYIISFAETFIHELATYASTAKGTHTRGVSKVLQKQYDKQGEREHDLKYVICGLYKVLSKKNTKGGFRKTRKLPKSSNTVKTKHNKQSRQNK